MPDNKGFVLIELLMKGLTVTEFLLLASMIPIQLATTVSEVCASREQAYFAAMQRDLENLDARQAIYYVDRLSYSSSSMDLRFTNSDGVAVTIVASPSGWSGTATHAALGAGEGCAIYLGSVPAPTSPVTPPQPGELACTS